MNDALGDRMKSQYEVRAQTHLPRRTYTIIRLDGKAFHTFTKRFEKPFDPRLAGAIQASALALCEEAQGSVLGYVQSDEISILMTDFANTRTDAWFDGNVQKICSVSASIVTAAFGARMFGQPLAFFDSRVFTIPDPVEVENYFIWRQKDAIRNSISALAQSVFSHSELQDQSCERMLELLEQAKKPWKDQDESFRYGTLITPRWCSDSAFDFVKERNLLTGFVPKPGYE